MAKKMRSVMSHSFNQIPKANISRSTFDRSHGYKSTFDAGYLVPIFVDEYLPGDTFNLNLTAFARLATPIKPVMDNMFMETFFFAVPNRLIWDNWQRFNGEQDNPTDSTDFLIPQINFDAIGPGAGGVYDYMGMPVGIGDYNANSLHNRAYALIWNQFFRDQNLQDSVEVPKDDGPDHQSTYALLKRGKRHDYFTSCLPWPQKGEAVQLPFGDTAPVLSSDVINWLDSDGVSRQMVVESDGNANFGGTPPATNALIELDDPSNLYVNLAEATQITVNAMREAFAIQKLYERDARGGTRYTEIINSHFGVTSPDARLQRPEFLGGGSTNINITSVPQTNMTNPDGDPNVETPQGNLAAYGTVSMNNHAFTKSFTEHGVIIGLCCVRADLTYSQGINRMFSRQTRWDFFWSSLQTIGEQEVLNKEIFVSGVPLQDNEIFGYQERHAEYRYKPSQITGQFRSSHPLSLDLWHLSQDFANVPTLNSEFIEENPPLDRVIATPDEPHFLFDAYFRLKCARPMPTYSVPGMIDHF